MFQSPVREGRGTVEGASGVREWVWGGCGKALRQGGLFLTALAVGDTSPELIFCV